MFRLSLIIIRKSISAL